jgi:predicted nucleotidyltransferase component of viral defense system
MRAKEFEDFRLAGGTALSLYRGHRESLDIDLFTDASYDSIDFKEIDVFLRKTFKYVDPSEYKAVGLGTSYFIGNNEDNCVKLDLYYVDKFIQEFVLNDGIRMATVEEIIAMKIDVISHGGRKKDFWDINELKDDYPIEKMLFLHKQRYPYGHDPKQIKSGLSDFEKADDDFDPICLRGQIWELIKLDLIHLTNQLKIE